MSPAAREPGATATSRRPPGRPRAAQPPPLRRDDLLRAAARSFAQGYASTSVRALARELGVSQGAVQYHARTKQDLFNAVIAELVVPGLAQTREIALRIPRGVHDDDGSHAVWRLIRQRVEALSEHGAILTTVLADTSPGAGERRSHVLKALGAQRAAMLDALSTLADKGLTRQVSVTTRTIVSMFALPAIGRAWTLLDAIDPGTAPDVGKVLDEITDILVYGLAAQVQGPQYQPSACS